MGRGWGRGGGEGGEGREQSPQAPFVPPTSYLWSGLLGGAGVLKGPVGSLPFLPKAGLLHTSGSELWALRSRPTELDASFCQQPAVSFYLCTLSDWSFLSDREAEAPGDCAFLSLSLDLVQGPDTWPLNCFS